MKNIIKLLYFPLALTIAVACQEKDNLDPIGGWTLTQPTLGTLSDQVLDEASPNDTIRFEWQASEASNRFVVQYTVVLVDADSETFNEPIFSVTAARNGKALYAAALAKDIDYALWLACYQKEETANLKWAVIAKAIETEAISSKEVAFTRFGVDPKPNTLFLTGSATEAGNDPANAVAFRAQKNASQQNNGIFDIYTTLSADASYEFLMEASASSLSFGTDGEGNIISCGEAIASSADEGPYRLTANFNDNSYNLLKIDKWSLVGDAVEGGWGGDVPLEYKGNGIWEAKVNFVNEANFIFRANGNWGYIIKRITGTATADNNGGKVIMESEKDAAGVQVEDIPATATGEHTVTLNLSANGYTYSLVPDVVSPPPATATIGESANPNADKVAGNFAFGEFETPATLFLVSDGVKIADLTKDGDVFRSVKYIALQASKKYILNTAADGSGTTYNNIGDGLISVARDQAYQINIDFAGGKVLWSHYNIKLFHWDDAGGWDARQELLMTYAHPYKYSLSDANLTAGFHSKFNSPWEVQFGTSGSALSGTMTNGGVNFTGISQTGVYDANITVSDDYTTATYEFVKQ